MTVRARAVVATVLVGILGVWLVVDDPDLPRTFVGKLTEGGMWTALALFIPVATVLGYRRSRAVERSSSERR